MFIHDILFLFFLKTNINKLIILANIQQSLISDFQSFFASLSHKSSALIHKDKIFASLILQDDPLNY